MRASTAKAKQIMATDTDPAPDVIELDEPVGGPLRIVDTPDALDGTIRAILGGTGPIGVDTERASGYRYFQRAYLIQLYRTGAGTFLLDPTAFSTLEPLSNALSGVEQILHAASQDLPSLREAGYRPTSIFDTELGSRLLGLPRVGLGAVVEDLLGYHLEKAYSAVDWSTRPLPREWIAYAALDVELLPRLRDELAARLRAVGKIDWAHQEFEAELQAEPRPPLVEPWRRLSGIHSLHSVRQLALARSLWTARDVLARERDIAPGRLLPDSALLAAATAAPRTRAALLNLPGFRGRTARSESDRWWDALQEGRQADPPQLRSPDHRDALPPIKAWTKRNPEARVRLDASRQALAQTSERLSVPLENLLSPGLLRRLCWVGAPGLAQIEEALAAGGARPWQISVCSPVIADAFAHVVESDPDDA